MTVAQLKEECKAGRLKVTGSKQHLIQRLEEAAGLPSSMALQLDGARARLRRMKPRDSTTPILRVVLAEKKCSLFPSSMLLLLCY